MNTEDSVEVEVTCPSEPQRIFEVESISLQFDTNEVATQYSINVVGHYKKTGTFTWRDEITIDPYLPLTVETLTEAIEQQLQSGTTVDKEAGFYDLLDFEDRVEAISGIITALERMG